MYGGGRSGSRGGGHGHGHDGGDGCGHDGHGCYSCVHDAYGHDGHGFRGGCGDHGHGCGGGQCQSWSLYNVHMYIFLTKNIWKF